MGCRGRKCAGSRRVLIGIVFGFLLFFTCLIGLVSAFDIAQKPVPKQSLGNLPITTVEQQGISFGACPQGYQCLWEAEAGSLFGTNYVRYSDVPCDQGVLIEVVQNKYCYRAQQGISYVACGQGCTCLLESEAQAQFGAGYVKCSETACGQGRYCFRAQDFAGQLSGQKVQSKPLTGSLAVSSLPPGASVSVDGQYSGKTPVNLSGITPGSHTVTLSLAGYQDNTQTPSVLAGSTTPLSVTLVPLEVQAVSLPDKEQKGVAQVVPAPELKQPNQRVARYNLIWIDKTNPAPAIIGEGVAIKSELIVSIGEITKDSDGHWECGLNTKVTPPQQYCNFIAEPDGKIDANDNCPTVYNPGQEDIDQDGIGDACTKPCDMDVDNVSLFSWRTWQGKDWLTSVKDQGDCGSCWAEAPIGQVEALYNIQQGKQMNLDLSEQSFVSPCYAGNLGSSCAGGDRGTVLNYLITDGIPDEACLPWQSQKCGFHEVPVQGGQAGQTEIVCNYDCGYHRNCGATCWDVKNHCSVPNTCQWCSDKDQRLWKIDKWDQYKPVGNDIEDIKNVKKMILCNGPLSVCSGSWWHCVIFVGWDDNAEFPKESKLPQGGWILKNSWGTDWEDGGYTTISYYQEPVSHELRDSAVAVTDVWKG